MLSFFLSRKVGKGLFCVRLRNAASEFGWLYGRGEAEVDDDDDAAVAFPPNPAFPLFFFLLFEPFFLLGAMVLLQVGSNCCTMCSE
jgi:hypothetical protein